MKISCLYLDTSFCYHVPCNRTIYSTRQKKHSFTCCSYRHTAWSWNLYRIYINILSDFNLQKHLRIMDINLHFWKCFKDSSTHFHVNLHRIHRIILSCTSGINLKSYIFIRICFIYIPNNMFCKIIKTIILYLDNWAYTYYSKYCF